jgi:hypothetical protein
MHELANEARSEYAQSKIGCSVKVIPDLIGKAIRIFDKMASRPEFSDIASGIHYSISFEKGDRSAVMHIKSLFMYPSDENKRKIASMIEEIRKEIQEKAGNELEPILRK